MSGQRKMPGVFQKKETHSTLNHVLDFGPENKHVSTPKALSSFNNDSSLERIKKIIKTLQEISKRIDNLADRF